MVAKHDGRQLVLLPSDGLRADRRHVLRWSRKVNNAQHAARRRVGGVTTALVQEGGQSRRLLKSVISGEVRWLPEDEDDIQQVFEWAREEIMCAFEAGVDMLLVDEIGPEVVHGLALDSALRACLWRAAEESTRTLFIVVADPSLLNTFAGLYGMTQRDKVVRMSCFREFVRWEFSGRNRRGGYRSFSWSRGAPQEALRDSMLDDSSLDEEVYAQYEYSHHGTGPFYSIVRLPLLVATMAIIMCELAGYILVRQLVSIIEGLFRSNRAAHAKLTSASHYASWRRAARELDVLENKTAGNVGHMPTIGQFSLSLERLSRELAAAKAAKPGELRAAPRAAAVEAEVAEVYGLSSSESDSGLSDVPVPPPAAQPEHELISCLRACTTSLVELVNEHLYSMNNVGTNLQMRKCVQCYLGALREVETTVDPELLCFRDWQEQRRRLLSTMNGAGSLDERLLALSNALQEGERTGGPEDGGEQVRASGSRGGSSPQQGDDDAEQSEGTLWRSPLRATLSALRSSAALQGSPTGRALLNKLDAFEREYADERLREVAAGAETSEESDGPVAKEDDTASGGGGSGGGGSGGGVLDRLATPRTSRRAPGGKSISTEARLRSSFESSKSKFFSELAHAYGETALCLSGGAANAYYHLGVVRTLLDHGLLPRHITGASGGALIGSFVCTRTDEELREDLKPEKVYKVFDPCSHGMPAMLWRLLETGVLFDVDDWIDKMVSKVCGTLTFQEAFEKTGRSFTITVYNIDAKGRNHTRCLNYKTAPDVVIYSAVLASSALPKLLPPIELLTSHTRGKVREYHSLGRYWRDGSFENELPFDALRQLFNVTFPIVSQVEPHISPFFYDNRGSAGKSVSHRGGRGWRGGFLLSYFERLLKLDLKKWLELVRDFNLLPKVFETDISSIFLGKTRGACTLVPPILVSSYANLVSDPNTPEKMKRYMRIGHQMAWPKLGMIEDRVKIERRLQELAQSAI